MLLGGLGLRVGGVWGGLHLYSVHAGLHFELLHSLPGLGDAGRAVVGDAVLHGAPVCVCVCGGGGAVWGVVVWGGGGGGGGGGK